MMLRENFPSRLRFWIALYQSGETLENIGRRSGIHKRVVRAALVENGITIRNGPRGVPAGAAAIFKNREEMTATARAKATSDAFARKLWAYGARHNGLPGFPPEICRELLDLTA